MWKKEVDNFIQKVDFYELPEKMKIKESSFPAE